MNCLFFESYLQSTTVVHERSSDAKSSELLSAHSRIENH